jgi:tetratricopeptide (TPR) repeat protein
MSTKRKMRRRGKAAADLLEIVRGPLRDPRLAQLPKEIRDALPRVHALVREDPASAIAELRVWIEREPLPMFFNWLGTAYGAVRDLQAMEDTVRENYRRNPQYVFARVNYAQLCLDEHDPEGVREALGEGFDIRALLGGRKRVHVSELVGYLYVVALYHLQVGDRDAAEKAFEILKDADPDAPATEELWRRLYSNPRRLLFG